MKLILAAFFVGSAVLGLSACRTEVDASYGYGYPVYGYPYGYPVIVGHDHDDHGGWHHEGGHEGGHPGGGHDGHHLTLDTETSANFSTLNLPMPQAKVDSATLLAQDYGLKMTSAQKIIVLASGKNLDASAADLGITKFDLAPLAELEMPSQSVLAKVAAHLGEPQDKIEKVFADFVRDISAEQGTSDDSL